jgi:WD40 repeat protein
MLVFQPHEHAIDSLRFSPDGRYLLTTTSRPEVAVLDSFTRRVLWADDGTPHQAAFAADGCTLFDMTTTRFYHDRRVSTRDTDTGRERRSVRAEGWTFAVTPDEKHLLFAYPEGISSYGRHPAALIRAELATGDRLDHLTLATTAERIVVSPDGRRATIRGLTQFALVDLAAWALVTSVPISEPNARAHGTRFAPDGRTVVSSLGPNLNVWDADTGAHLREVRAGISTQVQDLAFTPDGRHLFVVSTDTTDVQVRDTNSWALIKSYAWGVGELRCVDVAPDGTRAAVGTATGKIVVWDVDL